MPEPIRVVIVDDSAFVRRAVERMLSSTPGLEVVGTAATGTDAVALTARLRPDVVVLDVNMPEMDGLQALQRIMAESPTGVLMLSTLTQHGTQTTVRALELGAVDFLDKSSTGTVMDIYSLAPVLRDKVRAVAGAAVSALPPDPGPPEAPAWAAERQPSRYEMVAVGASTGGPRALVEVLSRLPADLGAGLVVAQHMPAGFTRTLAERLDRRSRLHVCEATDGQAVEPGEVLLAPGGRQIEVERPAGRLVVRVSHGTAGLLHRPSVDHLFASVARVVVPRAIGLVLTGMGDDGARGLQALHDAGARTLAESQESAVIYGMPRAAAPAAEQILHLRDIAARLAALCGEAPRPTDGGD